jgi:hypothetical protein
MSHPTLALAAILLAAVASQMLAARFRLPAIIPLLVAGVLMGPFVFDAIDPDGLLGNLLDPFVSLAVGAILFDGALTLRREQLGGGVGPVVARLVSLGVALTWAPSSPSPARRSSFPCSTTSARRPAPTRPCAGRGSSSTRSGQSSLCSSTTRLSAATGRSTPPGSSPRSASG